MTVQLRNISSETQTVTVVLPDLTYTKTVYPGNFLVLSDTDYAHLNVPLSNETWSIVDNPAPPPPPQPPVPPDTPTTDSLIEGVANLYFTPQRARNAVASLLATKVDSAANVGTGVGLLKGLSGTSLQFYNIKAGANVSVGLVGNDIVVATSGGGSQLSADLDLKGYGLTDSAANASVYVKPNGTGAFYVESSTSPAAGDARGANALDLQLTKTSPGQVASGANSALVGGTSNAAAADTSGIIAGSGNATGSAASGAVVAGGQFNLANNPCSLLAGSGAWDQAPCDLVVANDLGATGQAASPSRNHFRVAGDTSDVHVGRSFPQAAVANATNRLVLHTVNDSNQANYVALSAPADLTTQVSLVLPSTPGNSGDFLSTDGNGNLSWATSAGGGGGSSKTYTAGEDLAANDPVVAIDDGTGLKAYKSFPLGFQLATTTNLTSIHATTCLDLGGGNTLTVFADAGNLYFFVTTGTTIVNSTVVPSAIMDELSVALLTSTKFIVIGHDSSNNLLAFVGNLDGSFSVATHVETALNVANGSLANLGTTDATSCAALSTSAVFLGFSDVSGGVPSCAVAIVGAGDAVTATAPVHLNATFVAGGAPVAVLSATQAIVAYTPQTSTQTFNATPVAVSVGANVSTTTLTPGAEVVVYTSSSGFSIGVNGSSMIAVDSTRAIVSFSESSFKPPILHAYTVCLSVAANALTAGNVLNSTSGALNTTYQCSLVPAPLGGGVYGIVAANQNGVAYTVTLSGTTVAQNSVPVVFLPSVTGSNANVQSAYACVSSPGKISVVATVPAAFKAPDNVFVYTLDYVAAIGNYLIPGDLRVGVATAAALSGADVPVALRGQLVGGFANLQPSYGYYADKTTGNLTKAALSSEGTLDILGIAVSPTEMVLR